MADPTQDSRAWWRTSIIDIEPGRIDIRGYPIQDLIGRLDFVEMIWLMVAGEKLAPGRRDLLQAALVAAVDHGPLAPSISIARMAATCGVGLNSAMASAINVLGDVHGGAGQECLTIYAAVDERQQAGMALPDAVEQVLRPYLDKRRNIPGFGHRFHKRDPRAVRLLALTEAAAARGEVSGRFVAIGRGIEAWLGDQKKTVLPMNIDGATAVIFAELGVPPELGRGLFVLSRSVGILAHAWEQTQQGGRIKGPVPPAVGYTYEGPQNKTDE